LAENTVRKSRPLRSIGKILCPRADQRQAPGQEPDFEKEERQKAERSAGAEVSKFTFGDAFGILRENGFRPIVSRTRKDKVMLKPRSVAYYEDALKALVKTWPGIESTPISKVSPADLEAWSNTFLKERSATAHNHLVGFLRKCFDVAVEKGAVYSNAAMGLLRAPERPKKLELPTPEKFLEFVTEIENSGSGFSKPCANLVRFLAYGGFRKDEAAYIRWADCRFDRGAILVRGNPETGTKGTDQQIREVPMIAEMRQLLERLRSERPDEPDTAPIMQVRECQKAMDRAATAVGMRRITHHDLRHLFATRCIESGVDIPTISRWLGHKDGGALAMRVYGHLRDHHSTEMAKRVSFAPAPVGNIVNLPKQGVI
jgi:integrase